MSILLLALALAGPGEQDSQQHRSRDELACTLRVHALDELGQPQSARRVSAAAVPACFRPSPILSRTVRCG